MRWASGGIMWSSATTRLLACFRTGSVTAPARAFTPHETRVSAMKAAVSASTSAVKEAANFLLSRNRKPSTGGQDRRNGSAFQRIGDQGQDRHALVGPKRCNLDDPFPSVPASVATPPP